MAEQAIGNRLRELSPSAPLPSPACRAACRVRCQPGNHRDPTKSRRQCPAPHTSMISPASAAEDGSLTGCMPANGGRHFGRLVCWRHGSAWPGYLPPVHGLWRRFDDWFSLRGSGRRRGGRHLRRSLLQLLCELPQPCVGFIGFRLASIQYPLQCLDQALDVGSIPFMGDAKRLPPCQGLQAFRKLVFRAAFPHPPPAPVSPACLIQRGFDLDPNEVLWILQTPVSFGVDRIGPALPGSPRASRRFVRPSPRVPRRNPSRARCCRHP